MLTRRDIEDFAEINGAIFQREREAAYEAHVLLRHCPHWQEFERRRQEIYDRIGGAA